MATIGTETVDGEEMLIKKTANPKTIVVFRKWPKSEGADVIALFPYDPADYAGYLCDSYMHLGQHGAADPRLVNHTSLAKPEEYADLKKELESAPYHYNLDVRKRIPSNATEVRQVRTAQFK